MTQIGFHYLEYQNTSLRDKLGWFLRAPGLSAIEPVLASLGNLGNAYNESDSQVRKTLSEIGLDWTGRAATSAADVLHRAAAWSRGVDVSSGTGRTSVGEYGHSFEDTRAKVQWEDPGEFDWFEQAVDVANIADDVRSVTFSTSSPISQLRST